PRMNYFETPQLSSERMEIKDKIINFKKTNEDCINKSEVYEKKIFKERLSLTKENKKPFQHSLSQSMDIKREMNSLTKNMEKKQLLIEIKEKDKKISKMEESIETLKKQVEELIEKKTENEKIIAEQNIKIENINSNLQNDEIDKYIGKDKNNPNDNSILKCSSISGFKTEEEFNQKYSKLLQEKDTLEEKLKIQEDNYSKQIQSEIDKNNKLTKELFDLQVNKDLTTESNLSKINTDDDFKNLFKFTFKNYDPSDKEERKAFRKMEEFLSLQNEFDCLSINSGRSSTEPKDKEHKNILNK
ncbi:MAG: hypothetical protein MJ252_00545, partial [archaeon]|nr:hypothetical protein [archaeon]